MDYLNLKGSAKSVKDFSELAWQLGIYFNPLGNFTMLPTSDGHWLACFRRFQYYIEGDRYSYQSSPRMFYKDRHKHVFVILDKDFNLVERIDNLKSTYYDADEWKTQYIYDGTSPFLEDARLTQWSDGIYLTSAIYWYDEDKKKRWSTEVQKLTFFGNSICATHFWNSLEHGVRSVEKNWMSIPDKPLKFVTATSTNGAKVRDLKYDVSTEVCDFDPDDLYGGNANLLKDNFRRCYFGITHRYFHGERGKRTYENFVVQYDENLRPVKVSTPFKLCDEGIEFITWWHREGDDVLIGVTEMDDKPMVMRFDWCEFLQRVNMV